MSEKTKRTIDFDDDQNKTINAEKWTEMSPTELHDQLEILNARLLTAAAARNVDMCNQIQLGINNLQSIITSKTNPDDTLI